jgi:hypothetical protein
MKNIHKVLLTVILLPQFLIGGTSLKTLAQQQPQQSVRKEHLEYCINNLTVKVGQLEAIGAVKKQPNLTPVQKLEQINQILTPDQKQQLRACMQQPMPPQPSPSQG